MCLAVPMKVIERHDLDGTAEVGGVRRQVSLLMCPEASLGDYVLVHAGYAITLIDEEEARRTLELIGQIVEAVTSEGELP
jgi:hydrogenase expression/formation protein HypC